ncbi:MAG: hypothetical protein HY974_01050 [Candidatus Kerfeldbacteria bacterium]|nr:hypothetical protein [Candidatus Kerfeldbacteria bacterium]
MKQTNEQLVDFVAKARAAGKSTELIRGLLLKSGWAAEQVAPYLGSGDELVPPPPPPPKSSGRDIFFYLLAFFTLAISAVGLGGVIFAIINSYFPDLVVGWCYRCQANFQTPLASLVVAAPVYLFVMWKLQRDISRGLSDSRSRIRKVLTYIALFLASATVIGDIIGLVYNFLAGQVNTRFILKVLTILLLGAWIIWYYWLSLKLDDRAERGSAATAPRHFHRYQALAFAVVCVIALVSGFALMGSPVEQQKIVRDQRRLSDLQVLHSSIQEYYAREQKMPPDLSSLTQGYKPVGPQDPTSAQPYEYMAGQGSAYQLCAVFEAEDPVISDLSAPRPAYGPAYGPYDVNWTHPSGRHCFNLEAKRPK